MKVIKFSVLFVILSIVCFLGFEKVVATSINNKVIKEDLDIKSKIKASMNKKNFIIGSLVLATVLALGGIIGGVGYGIRKHRKSGGEDVTEEFKELFNPVEENETQSPFNVKAQTVIPEVIVTHLDTGSQDQRLPDVSAKGVDNETGENIKD
ncbi:early transcribed membrane protein [Plasmodium gonderi]|uniref:Early transcribed membrane protein n=1 Tax=Plasmodium gonderi TaxID=77519 RepID=A0A1Y1JBF5_PLAGO|nr:early transcribed membrane protein [Plasmodium gonderi]GAW79871.1 early transcribed membrane protein [Plasmodium gonderi]